MIHNILTHLSNFCSLPVSSTLFLYLCLLHDSYNDIQMSISLLLHIKFDSDFRFSYLFSGCKNLCITEYF